MSTHPLLLARTTLLRRPPRRKAVPALLRLAQEAFEVFQRVFLVVKPPRVAAEFVLVLDAHAVAVDDAVEGFFLRESLELQGIAGERVGGCGVGGLTAVHIQRGEREAWWEAKSRTKVRLPRARPGCSLVLPPQDGLCDFQSAF